MAKKKKKDPSNIADGFSEDEQQKIASMASRNYDTDVQNRLGWAERCADGYNLWALIAEKKNTPWEGASNVILPILATQCNQVTARLFLSVFGAPAIMNTLPMGENDVKRAKNVSDFVNWQLKYDMEYYEEEFHDLLRALPIYGVAFKKISWDFELEQPVVEYVSPLNLVVPYRTKKLKDATRITHVIYLHYEQLLDRDEEGLYINFDKVPENGSGEEESSNRDKADKAIGQEPSTDADKPLKILEVHMKYEYKGKRTPFIFTVDNESKTLLRAVIRADEKGAPLHYFQDYHFMNNPEGYYSFGYCHFLKPLNVIANQAFNQIFDSGTMTNLPFGFYGRKAGFTQRELKLRPGLMTAISDVSQVYFPSMRGVDQVLFSLLGLVQQYTEQFTSTSDYLMGREAKGTDTPTAHGTLAIIEQGLIPFNVQAKVLFRSLKKELETIVKLNTLFMPDSKEYYVMEGEEKIAFPKIKKKEFKKTHFHVLTVGDPSFASKSTRIQAAEAKYNIVMANPLIVGSPDGGMKPNIRAMWEALNELLEALDANNKNKLNPPLPEEAKSPEKENSIFMQGDYVEPVEGEDWRTHLQVHANFKTSEWYGAMFPDYKPLVEKHEAATIQMAYLAETQIQQLGGEGQPPGLTAGGGEQIAIR